MVFDVAGEVEFNERSALDFRTGRQIRFRFDGVFHPADFVARFGIERRQKSGKRVFEQVAGEWVNAVEPPRNFSRFEVDGAGYTEGT